MPPSNAQRQGASDDPLGDGPDGEDANDESAPQRTATTESGESDGEDTVEALRERLRNQRRVNSQLARRVKELEPQVQQQQSVEERATSAERDRDAARRELAEERALRQITTAATRAGATDPEDVADLMLRRNLIDFDDAGMPQDVTRSVADFKDSKPHLFVTANVRRIPEADAGRGNGGGSGQKQELDWNSAFRKAADSPRSR
jgi:hypothetical protein